MTPADFRGDYKQIGMEMQAFLAGSDMTRMVSAAQRADQAVNKTQGELAEAKTGGQSGNAALQDYKKSASDLVTNNEDQLIRMQALAQLAETKGCAPPQ